MKWEVAVSAESYYEDTIEADSYEEAVEIACENALTDGDYDYDVEYCNPVYDED